MSSTAEVEQDLCACGCKAVILPTDNHPWFKLRSCQKAWMEKPGLSEEERQVWMWQQRFYFSTVHNMPWGMVVDWEFEYTDEMVISWANGRMDEAHMNLIPLDPAHPDALADALRIMIHWNWKVETDYDAWMARDKLPSWVLHWHSPRRKLGAIGDALRHYGIVPLNWTGPSV